MGINPVCYCYSVLKDRYDLLIITVFESFFRVREYDFILERQRVKPKA